jgi:AcrR family transcriptional regulator
MVLTNSSGLKQRRMARTKAEIQRCALALFVARGFEKTTVAEIAAAAEVSPMTVFRYFPTKEDLVLTDDFDEELVRKIKEGPADHGHVTRIALALLLSLAEASEAQQEAMLARLTLAARTPALRGRQWENISRTQEAIVEGVSALNVADRLQLSVAAAACLSALTIVLFAWAERQGDPIALAREAFTMIGAKLEPIYDQR